MPIREYQCEQHPKHVEEIIELTQRPAAPHQCSVCGSGMKGMISCPSHFVWGKSAMGTKISIENE